MSLSTWKKEFYRIPASQVSKRYALQHSLRKWIGLRPTNRKKHNVSLDKTELRLVNTPDLSRSRQGDCVDCFYMYSDSCSLCQHFDDNDACKDCPLVKAGIIGCKFGDSPYDKFIYDQSVVPMIKALEKAQEWMRRNR